MADKPKNSRTRSYWLTGGLSLAVSILAVSGWVFGVALNALAHDGEVDNPIARVLMERFLPNPNLLVEDHVEISCEPEFSVKVFTGATLKDATFTVIDAATNTQLFGPKIVGKIHPLWQKVWLGPLSAIPPKIIVHMTAKTEKGKTSEHQLIVEPDCDQPPVVTTHTTIIWPKGKILFNPGGGGGGGGGGTVNIPLVAVVPRDLVGQQLVTAVIWQDPASGMRHYTHVGMTPIATEMLSLELTSANPIMVRYHDAPNLAPSFFDVFVEVGVGHPQGNGLASALTMGTADLPPVQAGDGVAHRDGSSSSFFTGSFFDVFFDVELIRLIDATPLEIVPPPECQTGASEQCGSQVGVCRYGSRLCVDGRWGECLGGIGPVTTAPDESTESLCNTLDDNCNGVVDEGCDCAPPATRSCGSGVGECRFGTEACAESGRWGACEGAVGPSLRQCDAADRDCDGSADYLQPPCQCQNGASRFCGSDVGSCQLGSQTCVEGAWGVCAGAVGPLPEVCDGLDNDCDGIVDGGDACSVFETGKRL